MTANPREQNQTLSVEQLRQIDLVCDEFESAFQVAVKSGSEFPSIASRIQSVRQELQATLLRHLIMLDMDYRERVGQARTWHDYVVEHNEFSSVVNELFVEANTTDGNGEQLETQDFDTVNSDEDSSVRFGASRSNTIGRFRIVRELGSGSFGTVSLAMDQELQRQVAIKVAHRSFRAASGEDLELEEARMAASLDHPAIVPVYECGRKEDGSLYVVTKLIDGTDLKTRMAEFSFTAVEAVRLIATIADAAHHAHNKGLVHRDIKPANILIDENHQPFLADFGLALKTEQTGTGGEFVGTPAYMSPEQARMEGHLVDRRSDVFSLAIVLYQLLFARLPFAGSPRSALLEAISTATPPSMDSDDSSITTELKRVICKALSRRAADRYQTAADFATELRACLAATTASASASDGLPITIVPRGLRAFTAEDAPFFQRLVPGPRNRNGLPESIAFWKSRIEGRTLDEAFRVGVLYGPSGTGKSSLVRAGVIPVLDAEVIPIWVTATAANTEADCLRALRRQFPAISRESQLANAVRDLRDGRLGSDQKLLIIFDQFEQWLSAHDDFDASPLVAALRQCDGLRVQSLVLVRDDYWYDLKQCLAAAEVETDSKNCRAADAFDSEHARAVLAEFGQAFGKHTEGNSDNERFIDQSISEMSGSSALTPVQLALFADVMKGKPWTPDSLRHVGGVDGATSLLLDQIVSGDSAHPTLKRYSAETGFLLRAMLPPSGTTIKASPQSSLALKEVSGLDDEALTSVLDVLDREYRIVAKISDSESDAAQYQLSHDYLVPIVRQWSQRTHGDTFAGRMELLLEDRTKAWTADRVTRNLPGPLEWLRIKAATAGKKQTNAARQMMGVATRRYGIMAIALLCAAGAAWSVTSRSSQRNKTHDLVERLVAADPSQVLPIVSELARSPAKSAEAIREYQQRHDDNQNEWALNLAVFVAGENSCKQVVDDALSANVKQLRAIHKILGQEQDRISNSDLAAAIEAIESESSLEAQTNALNAAALLALLDLENGRWPDWSPRVTSELLQVDKENLDDWLVLLRPSSIHLKSHVLAYLKGADAGNEQKAATARLSSRAVSIIEAFFSNEPRTLLTALEAARPSEFRRLMPLLSNHGEAFRLVDSRIQQLEAPPQQTHFAMDLPNEISTILAKSSGHANGDFALAMAVDRENFETLNNFFEKKGLGPRRIRSNSDQPRTFSVIWRPSRAQIQSHWDLTRESLLAKDAELSDWTPIEVSSDITTTCNFIACWKKVPRKLNERIIVHDWQLPIEFVSPGITAPRVVNTIHASVDAAGKSIFSAIERDALKDREGNYWVDRWCARTYLLPDALDQAVDPINFVVDFCVSDSPGPETAQKSCQKLLDSLGQREVTSEHVEISVNKFARARLLFRLGRLEESYELLSDLIRPGREVEDWVWPYMTRIASLMGKTDMVDQCVQLSLRELGWEEDRAAVEAWSVEMSDQSGIASFRDSLKAMPDADGLAYEYLAFLSCYARHLQEEDPKRSREFLDEIVRAAELVAGQGYLEWSPEEDPAVAQGLLASGHQWSKTPRIHLISHNAVNLEQIHSIVSGSDIHDRSSDLQQQGFQPQSVTRNLNDEPANWSIIWFRPKDGLPKQIADSRVASRLESVRVSLDSSNPDIPSDPRIAYLMVATSNERGMNSDVWWNIALKTENPMFRYFALSALAKYKPSLSDAQLDRLTNWYRTCPEPAVHSATRLLLEMSGNSKLRASLDQEFVKSRSNTSGSWFVAPSGLTFSVVQPIKDVKLGSPTSESSLRRWAMNEILHRRRLEHHFAISTTEIHEELFNEFRRLPNSGSQEPCSASWFEAAAFCRWLSERENFDESEMCYPKVDDIRPGMVIPPDYLDRTGYRLPNEEEWEIACRAGSEDAWYFGNDRLYLNHFATIGDSRLPVGSKVPNRLGLFDTCGNVAEWCNHPGGTLHPFTIGRLARPVYEQPGLVRGSSQFAVRGGAYDDHWKRTRSASRPRSPVDRMASSLGFRIVRTIKTQTHLDNARHKERQ